MPKRVLQVRQAMVASWDQESHPGVFVMHAIMAEPDTLRGWRVGTDIRSSELVSLNGAEIGTLISNRSIDGSLPPGTVVETLNTIYEVI